MNSIEKTGITVGVLLVAFCLFMAGLSVAEMNLCNDAGLAYINGQCTTLELAPWEKV